MSMLTLARLRTFCEVAEASSYSVAALRVFRSQPALSRQVAELELHLGIDLFERRGREVALTPAGRDLYVHARDILERTNILETRARALVSGAPCALRIGAHPSLFESTVPLLVNAYTKIRDDIQLEWCEGTAEQLALRVESRDLDLAFARYITSDSLAARRLFPMYLVAVVNPQHRLAKRKSLELDDLEGEALLLSKPDSGSRVLVNQVYQAQERRISNVRVEISSPHGLLKLASAGQGVALMLSMSCATPHPATVIPVLQHGRHVGMWSAVLWHRHRDLPKHALQMVDLAAQELRTRFPGQEFNFPSLDPLSAGHPAPDTTAIAGQQAGDLT